MLYVYVYIYLICIICIYVLLLVFSVICMHQRSESNAISIICMYGTYGRIDIKADFDLTLTSSHPDNSIASNHNTFVTA